MLINIYHAYISCYEFSKRESEPLRFHSVIDFLISAEIYKNLDNKYSPTTDVSTWFIWKRYVTGAIQKYACPFVCEKEITLEQGLESMRIFLKDRYLIDKEDATFKEVFKELQSIIDPESVAAEKFRKSLNPLHLITRSLLWIFSNLKKTKNFAELNFSQPKHDINFEHSEIWKFWLTCIEKSKDFNIKFQYNKKRIGINQSIMACYEYIRMDSMCDEATGPCYEWKSYDLLIETDMEHGTLSTPTPNNGRGWYKWMNCVQEATEKYNVNFADDPAEGLSLEQGLEAMRIFIEKYYYNKNNDIALVDVFKDMDRQINNNLETTDMWQCWLECFNEARKFDKIFYKEIPC